MKYTTNSIKDISYQELLSLMCKELNNAGYKRKWRINGNYTYMEYEPHEDLIISEVIDDIKALNYLKQIGLLDNGRCPQCGRNMNNTCRFTSGFNPNATYYICQSCYQRGMGVQNQSNPLKNNSGCMLFIVLLIISSVGLFFSYNQLKASPQKESLSNTMITSNIIEQQPLPAGYHWGKAIPYVGKNRIESNLISQTGTYNKALLRGDIDGAATFLYPDVITYFRKFYPTNFTKKDIIREFYKSISGSTANAIQNYEKNGMGIEFVICNIDKIVRTETAILSVFGATAQIYYEGAKGEKYFHVTPTNNDYTVGVSFNNGVNWYFMALNEDTPNVLRLKFSNDVISKVMNY